MFWYDIKVVSIHTHMRYGNSVAYYQRYVSYPTDTTLLPEFVVTILYSHATFM